MVIYRPSDRIPVVIGDVRLLISPLTGHQKTRILHLTKMKGGDEVPDSAAMTIETIKYCVKGIECEKATFADGKPISFSFEENGELDEDSVSALFQLFDHSMLVTIATNLLAKTADSFDIPGATVELDKVVSSKKN